MKKILILIFCIQLFSCNSDFKVIEKPTDYSEIIKRRQTIGVNFSEKGNCFMCLQNIKRFSPSLDEIKIAENILSKNLKETKIKLIKEMVAL